MHIGQKVRIREDLSVGHKIDPDLYVNEDMVQYAGCFTYIEEVGYCGVDEWLTVDVDDMTWTWSKKMLIPITQRTE